MESKQTPSLMRFGIRMPACAPLQQLADACRRAEQLNYGMVWIPDSQLLWRDVFVAAGFAAAKSSTVGLGTSVTNFRTRHPSVVASAMRTLQELAPRRVVLGVATGDSAVRLVGERPSRVEELRRGIEMVRILMAGGDYRFGKRVGRMRDSRGWCPIYIAASGPRTLELAGEIADGVITVAGLSTENLTAVRGHLEEGARRAGRDPSLIEIAASVPCHVSDDSEDDIALVKPICLAYARELGARTFLAMAGVELDEDALEKSPYPDIAHADEFHEAMGVAATIVSDEAAHRFSEVFCLIGNGETIRERIAGAAVAGVTSLQIWPVRPERDTRLPLDLMESFAHAVFISPISRPQEVDQW